MSLSSLNRRNTFQSFKHTQYDLVIIGAGITGAGIALDAVSRGMKVALLDKNDFAFGASSRSTKMVHGGLRYLQKFQLKNVSKSGKERAVMYENGPHVISKEKMLLPIRKGGSHGKWTTSLGLKLYDYLAGVKEDERRKMLSVKETLEQVPVIREEGLRGAGEYMEYFADDSRMTLEILKKAVELGADCLNYAEVIGFNRDPRGYLEAVLVKDRSTKNTYIVEGSVILNATGIWSKEITELENHRNFQDPEIPIFVKGAHVVFDQKDFPLADVILFETGIDKKKVFAIPHQGKTYLGASYSNYEGNRNMPTISVSDQYFLLEAANKMFPKLQLTPEMIESSWAGLTIVEDAQNKVKKSLLETSGNGLLTVTTGKLTGYRELAEAVVDEVASKLKADKNQSFEPCKTANLPFSGADFGGSKQFPAFMVEATERGLAANLTEDEARYLARKYGSNVDELYVIAGKASPDEMNGLPLVLYVQLLYGLQSEGIMTPSDFFIRRTGALYFDIESVKAHHINVVKLMARYFSWSIEEVKSHNSELEQALYYATHRVEDDRIVKLEQAEKGKNKSEEGNSLAGNTSEKPLENVSVNAGSDKTDLKK